MKKETQNPKESLKSKSIPKRAAAIRDFEHYGTIEDIPLLLISAKSDTSIAIRMMAADAVADILSRKRLRDPLTKEEHQRLFKLCTQIHPINNNAIYLVYATLGDLDSLDIILSGLKMAEAELRLGAAIGLLRFVVSYTTLGNQEIERRVLEVLNDVTLKADALAHLAQVCSAVGYRSALPRLRRIDLTGKHGETITQSQEKLRMLHRRPYGLWISDGRDAGEFNPKAPMKSVLCAIGRRGISLLRDGVWKEEGSIFHLPHRQMWFRRLGDQDIDAALQFSERTWYRCSSKKGIEVLKKYCEMGPYDPAYLHLAEALQLMFPNWKSKDHRDLGLMYLRAHAYDLAIECFNLSMEAKRTPLDTWIYKGDALLAQEKYEEARFMWTDCLERVRSSNSAIAQLCRARMERLPKNNEDSNEED